MKKLSLKLDELAVESFEPAAREDGRGTVHGHSGDISCPSCDTCNASMCESCYYKTCAWAGSGCLIDDATA
jgi:hypothetical protein